MPSFRIIPSIEQLLQREAIRRAIDRHGQDAITDAMRVAADDLRARLGAAAADTPDTAEGATRWLEARAIALAAARTVPSLRRVINATGVVIHTNLGRAPIATDALANAALATGYSNLEYDLSEGTRGHRHVHAERLLCELTGAEAALVANNAAAAAMLVLSALAAGREVMVSRGELVEIGGGFRVPDILAQSGAHLREVGTTNRTRAADYSAAAGPRTAMILRVHPSNFRVEGFTERPSLGDLVHVARALDVPLAEDLGSGWLGVADAPAALAGEPSVRDSIAAGADLVVFSGDKLLGGPQAGLIVGRRQLVDRLRAHPLMRAIRADKMTYAVLEATLALWAEAPSREAIPVYRMLAATPDQIERRARSLVETLGRVDGLGCRIIDGHSAIGGGSAPGVPLPTKLVALQSSRQDVSTLERALRSQSTPVIARIVDDQVLIDLRTVFDEEMADLSDAIAAAATV